MSIIVNCPDCGRRMSWQPPPIREFWCEPCDYLMDWDDVKERGNYHEVALVEKDGQLYEVPLVKKDEEF